MRGAPCAWARPPGSIRIIPADAGSTLTGTDLDAHDGDHPRGCGEHCAWGLPCFNWSGSSPRMRGARATIRDSLLKERIIPADAGSTQRGTAAAHRCVDHPRGCGEHLVADNPREYVEGSSPRMRGALAEKTDADRDLRIIPADAGSTYVSPAMSGLLEDHPRGCGEHQYSKVGKYHDMGSSPRMRGAHSCTIADVFDNGIIPADAGSTLRCLVQSLIY